MISDADVRALGEALRSEYAAIFGYGVVSAYISGTRNSSIAEVWSAHRSRRNRIIHLIEEADGKAPVPEVAYTSKEKVWDNLTAIQLAARIEDDCSVAWSRALQQCTTPESRKFAMQALLHTAEWTARWRVAAGTSPAIDPLPGLRRLDEKKLNEVDPGTAPEPTTPTIPSPNPSGSTSPTTDWDSDNNISDWYYNDQYTPTPKYTQPTESPSSEDSSRYADSSSTPQSTGDYEGLNGVE